MRGSHSKEKASPFLCPSAALSVERKLFFGLFFFLIFAEALIQSVCVLSLRESRHMMRRGDRRSPCSLRCSSSWMIITATLKPLLPTSLPSAWPPTLLLLPPSFTLGCTRPLDLISCILKRRWRLVFMMPPSVAHPLCTQTKGWTLCHHWMRGRQFGTVFGRSQSLPQR